MAISSKRVAWLMREDGLRARSAQLYRRHPGQKAFYASVPNQQATVEASAPNRVWVADVTYLRVRAGWRYLAVVLDRYSRRVVGWSLGERRDVSLMLAALNRAVRSRKPPSGLVFHSDRGSEFGSYVFRQRLQALGMVQAYLPHYNRHRIHSGLAFRSPVQFERQSCKNHVSTESDELPPALRVGLIRR